MNSSSQFNREWLARQIRHLNENPAALRKLADAHVSLAAQKRFEIGLSLPDKRRNYAQALCFPQRNLKPGAEDRYFYVNLAGVTQFASDADPMPAWCAGEPQPYFGFVGRNAQTLVWFCNVFDCWSVSDAAHRDSAAFADYAFLCGSHGATSLPVALLDDLMGARFPHHVIAFGGAGEDVAASVKLALQWRGARRLALSEPGVQTWAELADKGSDRLLPALAQTGVLAGQPDWRRLFPTGERPDRLSIGVAFAHGRLYLAYSAHREQKQPDGSVHEGEVCLVITSDGQVLEPGEAMPVAGAVKKVLRLSDGTALEHWPVPLEGCSWSQSSIHSFLEEKNEALLRDHPSLDRMLQEIEAHLRSSTWLPHEEDYLLLALVVACSYAQELFDAVPLVGLVGRKGTGKTELANTLAALGANGCLLQTFTEAAFVGAVNARRGLIVIDDLERIAPGRGAQAARFGHLQQLLKMSYKKATAFYRRCDGAKKEEALCTYGVKVINNTQGIDPIIADRMFEVPTANCPDLARWQATVADIARSPSESASLRDELHAWVFRNVAEIRKHYEAASAKADRVAEIMLPLRVLAGLAGGSHWTGGLDRVLARRRSRSVPAIPERLLTMAIGRIFASGYRHLSTVHVINEIRLILGANSGDSDSPDLLWLNSANIGRLLKAGWIEERSLERPFVQFGFRLRSYAMRPDVVGRLAAQAGAAQGPLVAVQSPGAFCRGCLECPYAARCEIARTRPLIRASA